MCKWAFKYPTSREEARKQIVKRNGFFKVCFGNSVRFLTIQPGFVYKRKQPNKPNSVVSEVFANLISQNCC